MVEGIAQNSQKRGAFGTQLSIISQINRKIIKRKLTIELRLLDMLFGLLNDIQKDLNIILLYNECDPK